MRVLEIFIYSALYTLGGIAAFGIHPEPTEVLFVYSVMFLNLIYNVLRDIYEKFDED